MHEDKCDRAKETKRRCCDSQIGNQRRLDLLSGLGGQGKKGGPKPNERWVTEGWCIMERQCMGYSVKLVRGQRKMASISLFHLIICQDLPFTTPNWMSATDIIPLEHKRTWRSQSGLGVWCIGTRYEERHSRWTTLNIYCFHLLSFLFSSFLLFLIFEFYLRAWITLLFWKDEE